ncbi:hypothetical protein L596_015361 [Steinernema carpocapsae]|uniref:Uncharacterized protein n=1 Tax=Steinernema carpocapsae TaxID=34508 RepID=A0A4U5NFR5_STECR|nr:hypothetical protein L596_015361 [Steinernema carpocapsae]
MHGFASDCTELCVVGQTYVFSSHNWNGARSSVGVVHCSAVFEFRWSLQTLQNLNLAAFPPLFTVALATFINFSVTVTGRAGRSKRVRNAGKQFPCVVASPQSLRPFCASSLENPSTCHCRTRLDTTRSSGRRWEKPLTRSKQL